MHSGATVAYPPGTANDQFEMALVLVVGAPGIRVAAADATGTPEGVGPLQAGDQVEGSVAGVGSISLRVGPAEA